MGRLPATRSSLVCLLAGLAGVPALRAQAPGPQGVELLPPQQVEVVRIEVVVAEKRGRPRGGLRREDFVVLEDGKPQPIVQFHAFARPLPGAPSEPSPAAPTEEEDTQNLLPARYVVLAIDDVHMEFESLSRVRKALARFLKEDLRPEDEVALVTTSGTSALSQEFTSDRAVLQQTLSRLSAQGRRLEWGEVPYISEYQAELIEGGDSMALDAAVQEILAAGLIQDIDSAEKIARTKARGIFAEAVYESRLTLETLESLCRGLQGITGRKALFLVSDGFLTAFSAGSGSGGGFDIRRIADAGTRAGVVIYSLDTRGLHASPPSGSAASLRRPGPATFGTIEAMRQRSDEATHDAMNALAADTGGFLVENSNNLRAGLRELLGDTETYYVLAYEPTNTRRDGGFRRIEVRLPGVPGVRVRTRSGYFAPDDRRREVAAGTAEADARRAEQRRAEMRTALTSLAPLGAIPVRLSADFVSLDGAATQVVVSGSVDVGTLPFVRRPDRREATVETAALVYDETGAVAATLETERTTVDLTDAGYGQLLRRGIPYQRAVPLKAGRYQVRLATREDATGLLGSAWQRVEVPDLATGRLGLSSLFLLKDEGTATTAAGADAAPVLRSVQDRPRFAAAENLYVQLYAYNPKRDASGEMNLTSQPEILRGDASLASGAPETMAGAAAAGPVPHISRIRLPHLEPGDYVLRVTVTDRNASAMAARSVRFTVD
jgi:VWFA-related protein